MVSSTLVDGDVRDQRGVHEIYPREERFVQGLM